MKCLRPLFPQSRLGPVFRSGNQNKPLSSQRRNLAPMHYIGDHWEFSKRQEICCLTLCAHPMPSGREMGITRYMYHTFSHQGFLIAWASLSVLYPKTLQFLSTVKVYVCVCVCVRADRAHVGVNMDQVKGKRLPPYRAVTFGSVCGM